LPDQSNIDQASVLGEPFQLVAEERTLAFYLNEEFLTLGERLLLAAGLRAERSSANGATTLLRVPEGVRVVCFPNLLGEARR